MLHDFTLGPETGLRATLIIAGLGLLLILIELTVTSPPFLGPSGPVPWDVVRLQARCTAKDSPTSRLLDRLFSEPRWWLIPACSFAAALVAASVIGGSGLYVARIAAIPVSIILGLLGVRSFYGLDGAYHMMLVIFGSVALTAFVPGPVGPQLAAGSIAVNACIAYLVSGVAKLASPVWRNGQAIRGILSTRSYGHPAAYRMVLSFNGLDLTLCWTVMIFEVAFVVAAFIGGLPLVVFLGIGVAFHLSIAAAMGLNGFLFAFTATFPCVLWSSSLLDGILAR